MSIWRALANRASRGLEKADWAIGRISYAAAAGAGVAAVAIAILSDADIFGRFVLDSPIPGAYAVETVLLVFLVFWSLAHATIKNRQIRFNLLLKRLPLRARYASWAIASILELAFFAAVALYSWGVFAHDLAVRRIMEAQISILTAIPWGGIGTGASLVCLALVLRIAAVLIKRPLALGEAQLVQE